MSYITLFSGTVLANYPLLNVTLKLTVYSAGKKKRTAQKGYFGAQKHYLFINFFFSCLKIVICELMLLELGDLLGLSLLWNFFSAANISAKLLNISNSSNLIHHFVLLIRMYVAGDIKHLFLDTLYV